MPRGLEQVFAIGDKPFYLLAMSSGAVPGDLDHGLETLECPCRGRSNPGPVGFSAAPPEEVSIPPRPFEALNEQVGDDGPPRVGDVDVHIAYPAYERRDVKHEGDEDGRGVHMHLQEGGVAGVGTPVRPLRHGRNQLRSRAEFDFDDSRGSRGEESPYEAMLV